ncbi:CAI-1 autoinducer sensor kinase/phosphatase CqsS [Cupriavidus pinatubonensis]|uniref:histidine kinase n=2 Tax=Cupriavidus pinatubonensis TaxID=248026 RepID=A0ABN7ZS47_9BURK|nr:CAI-1 autoinducer sensor kinase/phosphatase CqsS [Cupriavidus pinatubonensis]
MQLVGALGSVGHPLYYYIWSYVFPQPYENLWLRLLCTALFAPLLFSNRFSQKKWLPPYALFAITVGLPFAFVFFYLENSGSLAWAESVIIAVIILYHFGTAFATISLIFGSTAAVVLFLLAGNSVTGVPWESLLLQLPIIAFIVAVLVVIKLDRHLLLEQKQRGVATALATVAHELRTPLASLAMTITGLKARLSRLTQDEASLVDSLLQAAGRMESDLTHVNNSIELLVANSKDPHSAEREPFDPELAIRSALARFPFTGDHGSAIVSIEATHSANVLGNAQLFELVVTNLTKNALEAINRAGKGDIRVRCYVDHSRVHIIFRDTATGVSPLILEKMFQPFFSYPSHRGTGIGLAFCRSVLHSWGATISCSSVEHEFTEFHIRLPRIVAT